MLAIRKLFLTLIEETIDFLLGVIVILTGILVIVIVVLLSEVSLGDHVPRRLDRWVMGWSLGCQTVVLLARLLLLLRVRSRGLRLRLHGDRLLLPVSLRLLN